MKGIMFSMIGFLLVSIDGPGMLIDNDAGPFRYRSACGPIAVFVAVRTLGDDVSFDDVLAGCKIDGDDATSVRQLHDYLNTRPGLHCRAVRLTKSELAEYATSDQFVVILLTASGDDVPGHAICVTDGEEGQLTVVDYPGLVRNEKFAEAVMNWEGQALLVSRKHFREFMSKLHLLSPVFIIVTLIVFDVASRRK